MKPFYNSEFVTLYCGDCKETLKAIPDKSIHCCVTSPPFWGLRSYLPDRVTPKADCPKWVIEELAGKGIYPVDT